MLSELSLQMGTLCMTGKNALSVLQTDVISKSKMHFNEYQTRSNGSERESNFQLSVGIALILLHFAL